MEKEIGDISFTMGALSINLPRNRRGLSRYYSGKSRSFTCMDNVHCLDDLKKEERQAFKRMKRHSDNHGMQAPPIPCCRVSSASQFSTPIIGA